MAFHITLESCNSSLPIALCWFWRRPGHVGFDKVEISNRSTFDTHAYMHYLHHKYFNVNYGGDGLVPFDRFFGTYHDGSEEADKRMKNKT